ncbi:MAG: transglycosylase SLT domain-containing protein, partial [Treponema sp.]|nr:transglycosylase SLT domain-containing protein [Treponema sp.]
MGNREWIKLSLFLITGFMAWAQSDPGRPLRTVQLHSVQQESPLPTANHQQPANYQLLTASALEQALTQQYIAQYTSPSGIAWLNATLVRGSLYLPFIKKEIAARKLPPELAYLPIIESGFVSTARSRSGAVGLWQFMLNSISPFNIKVNDYMDERRDFQKSTWGALQKLNDNYKTLGDWPLALAAYNAGLGAVTRTVQRTKVNNYWELCKRKELRPETINYVPKLLAVAYVLSQPRRFGIEWPEAFEWIAIPLERQVSLEILAAEADVSPELLKALNSELLQGISPVDKNYRLKVPAAQLAQINVVLDREDLKLIYYHRHVIKHGDTLWALSRHYGVHLDTITQHNPDINSSLLKIGDTVIIPASGQIQPLPPAAQVNISR